MKTIEMNLKAEDSDKIKDGSKTIELRLFDEKRQQINLNDTIFFNKKIEKTAQIKVNVAGLLRYNSFQDLLKDFGMEYFGENSKEELLSNLQVFYARSAQEKDGVLGIKVRLVN